MARNTYLKSWWPAVILGVLGVGGLAAGPQALADPNPTLPPLPTITTTASAVSPDTTDPKPLTDLVDLGRTLPVAELEIDASQTPEFGELMIGGGSPATWQAPGWIAYIGITNWNNTGSICTGVLIAPQWVLTAGHCTVNKPRYINVNFGLSKEHSAPVDDYKTHLEYDAALLHLKDPVPGITPATLAGTKVATGTRATEYGWGGTSNTMMSTPQDIVATCYTQVQGADKGQFTANCSGSEAPGQFSYKTTWPGVKTEHGDSGGPLIVGNQVIGTLIGGNDQGSYFGSVIPLASWLKELAGVELGVTPPQASEYPYESRLARISGKDRVGTALALNAAAGASGDGIVLTTGLLAPDALSSAALVGASGATILLNQSNPVEPQVLSAIKNSGKKQLYLVGGGVHLSAPQRADLEASGIKVRDLIGSDRFDTAAKVAKTSFELNRAQAGSGQPLHGLDVFLVDATTDPNIPDAIASGAAVAKQRGVILFTRGTMIPPATLEAINQLGDAVAQQGGKLRLWPVGGTAATAANTTGASSADMAWGKTIESVNPIVGKDRYDTAVKINEKFPPDTSAYLLASGTVFADGLAGAGYAHAKNMGILLTAPRDFNPFLQGFVRNHATASYTIAGGTGAVSRSIANAVGALLQVP